MVLTYFGHSCFEVELNGKYLLFDPFITPNELAKSIDINKIKADYIFLSHGHEDHIADAITIAKRTGAKMVSNWEVFVWLGKQGIANAHPMNTGGKWNFDFGSVKCVSAIHSSSFPDGSYAGNPMGFVIESDKGNFYYSGDTALTYDMKLIYDLHDLDFAVLPIGDNFTMGVDDAIVASDFIGCNRIFGVHYDTFGFIKIDKEDAKEKFSLKDKELILLGIGESIKL